MYAAACVDEYEEHSDVCGAYSRSRERDVSREVAPTMAEPVMLVVVDDDGHGGGGRGGGGTKGWPFSLARSRH